MGFRDSLQDIISTVIPELDLVRKRIIQIAHYQRADGTCMHCYHPISGEGEFTGHKDDPLWLITAVWYYLAETADFSLLDEIGLITRCVWGKKENATIFNHTTTWAIMAECLIGNGKRALELYEKIAPISFDQERYQVEPYVYAQYTTSDEHETYGQGSHSWLSGTAAWMFRSTLDYMLGVLPGIDGLRIAPCIDPSWDGFKVQRTFRDTCPPQKKIFFRIQKALLIRIKIKLEVSLLAKRQSPELQKSSNAPC
jgi:cellobiose phosphorylase